MSTSASTVYSPGVLAVLPLLYVAWADSVLSPDELHFIRDETQKMAFLSKDDLQQIAAWTDADRPPNEDLFKEWIDIMRLEAAKLPSNKRLSMAKLGMRMARMHDEQLLAAESSRYALFQLEKALEQAAPAHFRNIFPSSLLDEKEETDGKPTFDVQSMAAWLDDDFVALRQKMRQLLTQDAFDLQHAPDKDEYRKLVLQWTQLLADKGMGALSYPIANGGKNDIAEYAIVFEMLGYHDISLAIKFGVQFGLFGGSILNLGTEKHHRLYLTEVGSLQLPGCFAMTETGHGSNVRGLETTATYDHATRSIVVHTPHEAAGKEYIGNALHSTMASVFAQLIVGGVNYGVHAVLVPVRDSNHQLLPGVRIEDNGYKLGLNGVDNGRLWFQHVRVPVENLLDKFGTILPDGSYSSPIESDSRRFFTMLGTLVGGRVCVPRAGLSAAKKGLTIAIRYAHQRRQFGPNRAPEQAIMQYPTHQQRLIPRLAKAYALDAALTWLGAKYAAAQHDDMREIETLAAGMKAYATWFTTDTLQTCREACGGKGYLQENQFAALKADTDIFTTFEGDNTVLMQLVAKGVLTAFKDSFHEDRFMGILRMLSQRVSTAVWEMNPLTTRNVAPEHLLDVHFHKEALSFRERSLTQQIVDRMQHLRKMRLDSYESFLQSQTLMMELAHAYVERIIHEQFVEAIQKSSKADGCRQMLIQLSRLFALDAIHQNAAFYLENGYMEGSKSKAIRNQIEILSKRISGQSLFLVEAFSIPDKLLKAPIAF